MSDIIPFYAPYTGWLILAALFFLGLWISRKTWWANPKLTYPHCPDCFYNLTGMELFSEYTCPECGKPITSNTNLHHKNRSWKLAILGLALAFALPIYVVQMRVRQFGWVYYTYVGPLYYVLPDVNIYDHFDGNLRIRQTADRRAYYTGTAEKITLSFTMSGQTIWQKVGYRWFEGELTKNNQKQPAIGKDITANGYPNFIFYEWTGGAHGMYIYHITELRNHNAATILHHDFESCTPDFVDLDGDGYPEITGFDATFSYAFTSYAGSPRPRFVMKFDGNTYAPCAALMRRPPYSAKRMANITAALRPSAHANPNNLSNIQSTFLTHFTDLIYTGHANQAISLWETIKPHYPQSQVFQDDFVLEFSKKIRQSPYYSALRELNGDIFEH